MVVTDPIILAEYVDNVLIVIKKGDVSRDIIKRSIQQLAAADQKTDNTFKEKALLYNRVNMDFSSNIIGAVLNQVDYKKDYYYYHYHRYYKEYYSEKKI